MSPKYGRTFRQRRKLRQSMVVRQDENLLEWMPSLLSEMHNLGWKNPGGLHVRRFADTDRGLCLKRGRLHVGDELIRMPISCMITLSNLENDAGFKRLFRFDRLREEENAAGIQAWLAFYLIYKNHRRDTPLVEYYARSLPDNVPAPMFATNDEIMNLPSGMIERILVRMRSLRKAWQNLFFSLEGTQCECCGIDFHLIFDLTTFKRTWYAVNTRCIYIDLKSHAKKLLPKHCDIVPIVKDTTNIALAPFLDMFNHSDKVDTTCTLVWSDENQRFELVLKLISNKLTESATIRANEEIFISYGPHSDFDLLMEYGMLLPNNEHNCSNFSLDDISEFLEEIYVPKGYHFDKKKFVFLRNHNFGESLFVQAKEHHVMSHNLQVVLYLLVDVPNGSITSYAAVAFGNAYNIGDCQEILLYLLDWRCKKYTSVINKYPSLAPLTQSGHLLVKYLRRQVEYLEEVLCLEFRVPPLRTN